MSGRGDSSSWLGWYDGRPLRERILLLCCLLAVLTTAAWLLIFQPGEREARRTRRQIGELQTRLVQLESRAAELQARGGQDPDRQNRLRVDALEQEAAQLQRRLEKSIVDLVPPREMPRLLKKLLAERRELTFLSLENLPPEPVDLQTGNDRDTQVPQLYRHRLRLEFSGSYLGLVRYLRQLTELPRHTVWEDIAIETRSYPEARVHLQLHTLSLSEGWIGG